ncbi:ATP-binding cassette subfamily C protein/ATP-binding cassette subfamily C protein CydD [Stackebrandtia albiflava]|uniref:ATP-binding cassette subfamily C protein/ATP-binding cassette subfamily C protein CydD n=1 Tax=Stackebrandtia albiflava TaxID=406432 RepID=A0A562UYY2_9ACTN|nr:thiol reductant ABC exporter subunit CydD [Stackebrandtia albiflava]TWJ10850.1 ATP-binding cassette subfamily C protein/ATP-binding cassette subfamily C protein CydD [Stackebrandtia albiflava]
MRPVDPAMLRRLPSLRRYLRRTAVTSVVSAGLIIGQAAALSVALATAVRDGLTPEVTTATAWFLAAVAARAAVQWWQGASAARGVAEVKTELRDGLFRAAARHGPTWRGRGRTGEAVTLVTRGVDGLDAYVSGYLPQLCLAAVVPVAILVVMAVNDPASMIVVLVTIPLIPVFGVLIGWHTKAQTERQWHSLRRLGGHFLDAVAGLPTSRVFGRAADGARAVLRTSDDYRAATMATLRVAFLSALALELVATVSVALVAVPIGLQLLGGDMDLRVAFLILLLAPEVYLPLRSMGSRFHAAQEGLAATGAAFDITDTDTPTPEPRHGKDTAMIDHATRPSTPECPQPAEYPQAPGPRLAPPRVAPDRMTSGAEVGGPPGIEGDRSVEPFLRFTDLAVTYPGAERPAVAGLTATVAPGELVALVGRSGAGKSTVLNALLGFAPVTGGALHHRGSPIRPGEAWLRNVTWVPQRAHLFAMSVADNIRLGQPTADPDRVRAAADAAFATEFVNELPEGFDTPLGDAGFGLSAGQRRRIALARAFLRIQLLDCPLVLLDEPTAGLDLHSEARVAEATARLLAGRTAILVAHRESMLDRADQVWRIADGALREVVHRSPAGAVS